MRRLLYLFVALVPSLSAAALPSLDAFFPQSSVVITAAKACYRFEVHVAVNDAQRARGLMHVRQMDRWRGMLFVYARDAEHSMWMKNTFIPLDMLFVRANGEIARVATDTEPQSLASVSSGVPVRYVLELNAGVSAALGIEAGDHLLWAGDLRPPSQD